MREPHPPEHPVSKPFSVTISHTLGKDEAARRIKGGLGEVTKSLADNKVVLVENAWTGDRAEYSVKAVGQTVTGTIEVGDDFVKVEAQLPWVLSVFAEKAKGYIASRGSLLLEKK
jgi:hypothetical protein